MPMTLSPHNQQIVDEFQRGYFIAVKEMYDEYYSALVDFGTQLILNNAEAHHIAQETFIKLFQMRNRFNKLPDIKAFLYITVRNICFAYVRSEQANEPASATGSEAGWYERSLMATARFKDGAQREEALCRITKTVGELPEPEQTVFKTIFCNKLTIPEAAKQLKLTTVAVTQHRINAIRKLREELIKADLFSVPLFIFFVAVFCGRRTE
jgi:RNA polymerase sigma factor (sigma-70 family)